MTMTVVMTMTVTVVMMITTTTMVMMMMMMVVMMVMMTTMVVVVVVVVMMMMMMMICLNAIVSSCQRFLFISYFSCTNSLSVLMRRQSIWAKQSSMFKAQQTRRMKSKCALILKVFLEANMTLSDFNNFHAVESSYKKELVCQILCWWPEPFQRYNRPKFRF